jgi:competence protein ComEA
VEFDAAKKHWPRVRLRVGLGAAVVLVLLIAAVAVVVSAVSPHGSTVVASEPRVVHTAAPEAAESPAAMVHLVGQVAKPGVYELPAGSRLLDAVAAAGGFTAAADQANLNLAQIVEDGQQVVVPAVGEVAAAASPAAGAGAKVNLNTADSTTLQTLDGVGPSLAQRILAYRAAHGGFRSVNDLQNVTGIGPRKFAAIKAGVTT